MLIVLNLNENSAHNIKTEQLNPQVENPSRSLQEESTQIVRDCYRRYLLFQTF